MGRPKRKSITEGTLEESLISAVFKRPCLYDLRDKNYSQTKKKERIWTEISVEVKADVSTCKTRWRSLRDTFKRVDMKARSSKSGDGLEETDERTTDWPWYTSLLFLRESNYQTKTTDSIETQEVDGVGVSSQAESARPDEVQQAVDGNVDDGNNDSNRPCMPPTDKGRAQKKKSPASQWNNVIENLKEVVKGSNVGSETASESFAVYIAKELEEMSEIEKVDFKFDVMGMIRSIKRARLSTRIIEVEVASEFDSV